jgi:hypothetical protein
MPLEAALLSLQTQTTITILGQTYQIKNVVAATDGKVLKAHLILLPIEGLSESFAEIEFTTKMHSVETLRF